MDIKVNGRTLSDRPLVLGVQGDNNVEELRFLVPRYTDVGVDLSLGIGYAVFRLPDGTDGHVSLTPKVSDTDENTVSLTLLVGSQMTEQKGFGKLCLKVAGLESAMWSSTICDMFVNGTIALPSPQPVSLFRTMSVGPRLAEDESEPPLTVTERTINIPAELQTIAVAQDENSETVKIVVPRYFDGQDLSVHDFILHTEMGSNGTDDILFNNQNGQMKEVEDSTVTLTWVLRPPQTSYEGKLNIQLLVQGDEFKWHSLIGELTIAKHITGDPVVPATPSMYEQWLAEVKEQADYVRSQAANIQTVVDEIDAIKDAPAAAERAEAAAAEAEKSAAESKGFRKFYSAVVPDANGNLDPSRPMTVGPAASVEIESAGDRIQSVTVNGFTQQAGTGDPSPTNVRQLTNGGLKLVKLVLTGAESFAPAASPSNLFQNYNLLSGSVDFTVISSNYKPGGNAWDSMPDKSVLNSSNILGFRDSRFRTAEDFKAMLAARYAAGDPVIVWYQPADESQATGLYAPIILTSGEYRATCLPLTAPLCEGDSAVSWVKSGCDQVVTFDGSEDESWVLAFRDNGFYIRVDDVTVLPGSTTLSGFVKSTYLTEITSNQIYHATAYGISLYNADPYICVRIQGVSTVSALKEYLADHPLTVWYRSTAYTEAADKPVSLETHVRRANQLDGTEAWELRTDFLPNLFIAPAVPGIASNNGLSFCDMYKIVVTKWDKVGLNQVMVIKTGNYIGFRDDRYSTADAAKRGLAESPVTIVYELATPLVYAHEAMVLEAATGEQLTYTVTGQSGGTVSVALKPFQDGGHAAMADSATNAQNADNANRFDGLTLSALQDLLVPVGYIFSWAPVDDGPDLSTPAKVAAYFGFGTWAAYGAGQVLVGLDAGQTEFATVGQTGGEKAHSLTTAEGPKHAHGVKWEHEGGLGTGNGVLIKDAYYGESYPYTYFTEFSGSGQAHNNLQPYITVYRWQRVA